MVDTKLWLSQLEAAPIPADRLLLFLDAVHLLVERTSRSTLLEIANLERDERENPQGLSLEKIDALFADGRLGVTAQRLDAVLAELAFSFYEGRRDPTLAGRHPHWQAQVALRAFLRENLQCFVYEYRDGDRRMSQIRYARCESAFWTHCLPGIFCENHRKEHIALARLYAAIASGEITEATLRK